MSKFKLKIDTKKIEKDLNKQLEKIVYEQQRELILKKGDNEMTILPQKEEELLQIILSKYDGNEEMNVNGNTEELPKNMRLGLKDIFNTLKLYNYISEWNFYIGGEWFVVLNQEGIDYFDNKIKGFNGKDAIIAAPETRTSSPIRILRDENLEASIKGIYPCGEGAGYAGGITTSAMDGMKIFESIYKTYKN